MEIKVSSELKRTDKSWCKSFKKLVEYYNENGNVDIGFTTSTEDPLSIFVYKQRFLYRNKMLCQEKIDLLNQLGIKWDSVYKQATDLYDDLFDHFKEHGTIKNIEGTLLYKYDKLKYILEHNRYDDLSSKLQLIEG